MIETVDNVLKPLRFPIPAKPRQTGLAGKELLHGGLLDGPLLGDQLLQRPEQLIPIRQRLGDGALFGKWWSESDFRTSKLIPALAPMFDVTKSRCGLSEASESITKRTHTRVLSNRVSAVLIHVCGLGHGELQYQRSRCQQLLRSVSPLPVFVTLAFPCGIATVFRFVIQID